MEVVPVACLKDNYAYLLVANTGEAAIIDASEAAPVREAVAREGVTPRAIWSTHHHWDHVGGNQELATEFGVDVFGHVSDKARIPGLTVGVESGAQVRVGEIEAICLHVPGHTLGALAYFVDTPRSRSVFTGDTLFRSGCGRLFEGTAAQMSRSLACLAALPGDTRVYCGHEYTIQNLRFAAHVDADNIAIVAAREQAAARRAAGQPTVGVTLDDDLRVNPFLRLRSPAIRMALGIPAAASDAEALASIRSAKDAFV